MLNRENWTLGEMMLKTALWKSATIWSVCFHVDWHGNKHRFSFTTSLSPQLKLYVCYKMLFERCCHIPGMMMYHSSNTIGIVSVWSRGEILGVNPEVKPMEDLFCSRAHLLSGKGLCCSTTESLLRAKFYINSWLESSLAQASTLFPSVWDTH